MSSNSINTDNLLFNVNEIFYSIQGEGTRAGRPCIFVRFQGCELRCSWCDTPYALDLKQIEKEMTGTQILDEIKEYECKYILFTGGEPLLQRDLIPLLDYFVQLGYETAIETNGHQSVKYINPEVIKILDLKAPGSGMDKFNNLHNLKYLTRTDEIKIIVTDRNDYEWSKKIILEQNLHDIVAGVILSPALGKIDLKAIAEWILEDNLPVRLQAQLHKIIWSPEERGV
jgi:7-carboxy-7-deazaguanine synthase